MLYLLSRCPLLCSGFMSEESEACFIDFVPLHKTELDRIISLV